MAEECRHGWQHGHDLQHEIEHERRAVLDLRRHADMGRAAQLTRVNSIRQVPA